MCVHVCTKGCVCEQMCICIHNINNTVMELLKTGLSMCNYWFYMKSTIRFTCAARSTRIHEYDVRFTCSNFSFGTRDSPLDRTAIPLSLSYRSRRGFHSMNRQFLWGNNFRYHKHIQCNMYRSQLTILCQSNQNVTSSFFPFLSSEGGQT